jgi:hypothetical protein
LGKGIYIKIEPYIAKALWGFEKVKAFSGIVAVDVWHAL